VDPELGDFPGHVLLLVRAGIYIFENLKLHSLADAELHEFLFVAAPLKYVGATAGPVRPLAIGSVR
jgi:kynurenine formamidase